MKSMLLAAVLLLVATATLAQETQNPHTDAAERPRLIRVSGSIMIGILDHGPVPTFPEEALRKRIAGDVVFRISVNESGKIVLCEAVEGDPLLVAVGVDALNGFRFQPYFLNGQPIKVETQLGFHFRISGNGNKAKGRVELMSSFPDRPEFRSGVLTARNSLVLWPKKVSGAEPQLPAELAGKSGSVYLTVTVVTDGRVQDVKVISGDEAFAQFVVAAVRQFVYEPQLVDGKPSLASLQASYHFGTVQ